ncbi:putative bifunctional diguanylate cyclase/phosphodiesterase [Catenovulum adriaticum]|uniref:EAL domain-containing protein n=1 Tax=Catenovulum adriaticum TaxID=2984846 RepID=A0ABY7APU9_9ALTE|nr:EAL domain-containing protein [Catenovulum sp. TS8]WAJ70767.1 EAL domain-containing protein [Catenovulum sp. TS8]
MFAACYALLKKLSLTSLKARVVLAILGSSLATTLLAISIFSAFQYQTFHAQVNNDVQENINIIIEPLSEALWSFKGETAQFIVNGLTQLPFVSAAKVTSETSEVYLVGESASQPTYIHQLIYQNENVGELCVWLNNIALDQYILDSLVYIAIVYILSSLMITLILIKLFDFMVSRHLFLIASSLKKYNVSASSNEHINLNRHPCIKDELSMIVDNLNRLKLDTSKFISAKQEFEDHLTYQANYDDLTGLPNRRYGLSLLENKIKANNSDFSLMFIDLDGFKEINDTHQHLVGDQILQIVADRLNNIASSYPADVARIGGDEFMFIVDINGVALENLAGIIINTIKAPYHINNDKLLLSCSIGIASYPTDALSATALIANADTAMFEAKSAGKSQYKQFSAEMFDSLMFKSKLKNSLGSAIQNQEISVYFQPIFSIDNTELLGFESLCRWYNPEFGHVRPDIFIALAEETGDIVNIDRFVLTQTVQLLHSLESYCPNLFGTVNFCPLDFAQTDLIAFLSRLLTKYPLTQTKLEIEVTERSLLHNDSESGIQTILNALSKLGVKISIDDFGTGYSALSYVKHYRQYISKIKIDSVFIRDIVADKADSALVNAIIKMAEGLEMKVVAEGIETHAQRTTLNQLGCEYGQGYLISKPLSQDDFLTYINTKNSRATA